MNVTPWQAVGVCSILFVAYVLAKAAGKTLDRFGPDARARRDRYSENANRALVKSRIPPPPSTPPLNADPEMAAVIEKLIENAKTPPHA
ncbi:MAG: hypothetical protein H0U66_00560 [Gemmatimonadaceae bacterium]|nr:hypothetical protein [Gemmatimonadaceae bacterium]